MATLLTDNNIIKMQTDLDITHQVSLTLKQKT